MKILDQLDEAEKAARERTGTCWEWDCFLGKLYCIGPVEDDGYRHNMHAVNSWGIEDPAREFKEKNSEFAALMRNNLRALIDVAKAAQMQLDYLVKEKKNHYIVLDLEEALSKLGVET